MYMIKYLEITFYLRINIKKQTRNKRNVLFIGLTSYQILLPMADGKNIY